MKNYTGLIFFSLIFIFIPNLAISQEENPLPVANKVPDYDIPPQFPGGTDSLKAYFVRNIQYPEPEKSKGIQGYVALKFEVTKKGKIINVSPVNGVPGGPNLVHEAIRVVLQMPPWIPATKKGKKVQAEFYLNVPFSLKSSVD